MLLLHIFPLKIHAFQQLDHMYTYVAQQSEREREFTMTPNPSARRNVEVNGTCCLWPQVHFNSKEHLCAEFDYRNILCVE